VEHVDGSHRSVMKHPSTDSKKVSLPGELQVARNTDGVSQFVISTEDPAEPISATGSFSQINCASRRIYSQYASGV
jgi:hypothetical protein